MTSYKCAECKITFLGHRPKSNIDFFCSRKCSSLHQKKTFLGSKNPFFQKKHKQESKDKISNNPIRSKKISDALKGRDAYWVKGDKNPMKDPKIALQNALSRIGYKMTEEQCEAVRQRKLGKPCPWSRGDKSNFWIDGRTPINNKIRASLEMKIFRRECLERDEYTCQECGVQSTKGNFILMHVHHIKSFSKYPELRFNVSNGRTLCVPCHEKTDNYAGKALLINH